jgi:hypothetical protein
MNKLSFFLINNKKHITSLIIIILYILNISILVLMFIFPFSVAIFIRWVIYLVVCILLSYNHYKTYHNY